MAQAKQAAPVEQGYGEDRDAFIKSIDTLRRTLFEVSYKLDVYHYFGDDATLQANKAEVDALTSKLMGFMK